MELRTEVEIEATPGDVWSVLVDFQRFPEWNPLISSISGDARVGARLHVLITPPDSRESALRPQVLVVDPERELRWSSHFLVPGLFDREHFFRLVEVQPGRTRVIHGENFSGILLKALTRRLTSTARGFVFMNQALKRRVESLGRGSSSGT